MQREKYWGKVSRISHLFGRQSLYSHTLTEEFNRKYLIFSPWSITAQCLLLVLVATEYAIPAEECEFAKLIKKGPSIADFRCMIPVIGLEIG